LEEGITPNDPTITPETMALPRDFQEPGNQVDEVSKNERRRMWPRIAGALLGVVLTTVIARLPYESLQKVTPLPVDNPTNPAVLKRPEGEAEELARKAGVVDFVLQPDVADAQEPESEIEPQIVGGKPAEPGRWPFVVALFHTGESPVDDQYCGGVLLNRYHVLTAGHCTSEETAQEISIFVGRVDLRESGEVVQVSSVHTLPCFDAEMATCDFAILFLNQPVTSVEDFALVAPGTPNPGVHVTILGWGRTSEGGSKSPVLMEAQEPVWSLADCRARHPNWFTDDMICAGYLEGGVATCNADSGGPAMGGDIFVAGVNSWGVGCGDRNEPDYFAAVQRKHLDWALGITGVPVYGIRGDINEDTGSFSFTALSPYSGRIPDTPANWTMESDQGWSLSNGAGLNWSGVVTYSLEGTQVITITTVQENGVKTRRIVMLNPVGVVYLPVILR